TGQGVPFDPGAGEGGCLVGWPKLVRAADGDTKLLQGQGLPSAPALPCSRQPRPRPSQRDRRPARTRDRWLPASTTLTERGGRGEPILWTCVQLGPKGPQLHARCARTIRTTT